MVLIPVATGIQREYNEQKGDDFLKKVISSAQQSPLLAHIRKDGATQTLEEHLRETARLAEQFAQSFQAGGYGKQVGGIHDKGKASQPFQDHLHGDPRPVNHSDAGAQMLYQQGNDIAAICVTPACPITESQPIPRENPPFWGG